jgi:shikimate dehydrogenase
MFKKLGLPHTYTALECTDLEKSVNDLKKRNAAGFSVSMPYKSEIIKYLDVKHLNVDLYKSCNTVVNKDGVLHGYTADYFGVLHVIQNIEPTDKVSILGDGNMATMIGSMFKTNPFMYSKKLGNWNSRHKHTNVLINCTALGTSSPDSPVEKLPDGTKLVIDLAIKDNQLKEQCSLANVKYVPGMEFYKHQFLAQFQIYTGIEITAVDFDNL